MKKLTTLLMMLTSITFFSTSALAAEGEGTVDEVRVCTTGSYPGWINFTYFKLSDGQWFVFHNNFGGTASNSDIDMNATYSLVMSAYASRYKVKVNANYPVPSASYTKCGITPVAGLWNVGGDYIALKEYSE
jgi:hypothetical protein